MVSFKSLFVAGAFLIAAVNSLPSQDLNGHGTSIGSGITTLVERDGATMDTGLTKRAPGRQLLCWSPGGTVLYLLGSLPLPTELQELVHGHSQGTPAQMLLYNWVEWVKGNLPQYRQAYNLYQDHMFNAATVGGVYGVGDYGNLFGFGFSFTAVPAPADLANLVAAIQAWASQNDGRVGVVRRTNGFFNPSFIGAGLKAKRFRDDKCPADIGVLKFATKDVPEDLDFKTYTRWAGMCSGMP